METKTLVIAAVIITATVGLAVSSVASNPAYAAITTQCTNSQGHTTSGCNGQGGSTN